jgi:META domain
MQFTVFSRGNGNRAIKKWSCLTAAGVGFLIAASSVLDGVLAQAGFPFDQEMQLDTRPLPGSRRVPMLEIQPDGRADVDLWCHSGPGRVEVMGASVKITLGQMREEACTPERAQRDEELAAALAQVTRWRVQQDVVVLSGSTELRYRLSTH